MENKESRYKRDIKEWTLSFAISIIKFCVELKKNKIDFDVIDQIRRSGTSIGANVKEANSSSSKKELIRYYSIALRSANETDYWFDVIHKGYNFETDELIRLKDELNQLERIISSIIIKLKSEHKLESIITN